MNEQDEPYTQAQALTIRAVTRRAERAEADQNPDREKLGAVIASVTDLWEEPLDEVHDIPQIVNAILASEWLREHDAEVWDEAARNIAVSTTRNNAWPENPYRRGEDA